MTMPNGYIGGPGVQPMMNTTEAQVVGQQPMLPGLMVMGAPLPSATPVFAEARSANEHSEHMLRNLMIGFDVFERYFQQMEKHSALMEANNAALLQHTQALVDLEKKLTDTRKEGAQAAAATAAHLDHSHKKLQDAAQTLGDAADNIKQPTGTPGRPGAPRPKTEPTDPHNKPDEPDLQQPGSFLEDYRAGGMPRVISARLQQHYGRRIKALGGDRQTELEAMETRTPEQEQELTGLRARTDRPRRLMRTAQNVEEHGAMGALSKEFPLVARFAGGVGLATAAVEGVQKLGQFVSGEREQAAEYQQGIGGSEAGGLWQGARERLFGIQNMFGMGDARARELYKGVTSMGIDDAQGRQSALSFATRAFQDTGMQVSQSLELIRTAAQSGITDFSGLGDAIDKVSKAARVGGMSVAQAQAMFQQNMQQVSGTVGGQTSIPVATAITTAQAQLGPNVGGQVSISGAFTNQTAVRREASASGMTYGQFLGRQMADPNFALKAGQANIDALANAVVGPEGRARLSQMVKQTMAGGVGEQAAVRQVAGQAMEQGIINPDRLMAIAPSYGVQSSDINSLVQWIVQASIGGVNVGPDAQKSPNITTAAPGKGGKGTSGTLTTLDAATKKYGADKAYSIMDKQDANVAQSLGYGAQTGNSDVINYEQNVDKYGRRDPVIEALLKKGVYDPKARYRVQTKDGPRDVSLGVGMHHYADQFAHGDVEIVAGEHKNQTVGQVTGISDPNRTGANLNPNSPKDSSTQGAVKGSDYSKKPGSGDSSGTVIIKPSPELQRILQFYPSGGAYIDTGRQSGIPSPAFAPVGDAATAGSGY